MTQKFDLHQVITDQIIQAIETGVNGSDWQLPWVGLHNGLPFNTTTNRRYRGINILLLWCEAGDKGYPTNEWASFKQWRERGANVCKGEKGTMIVFTKAVVARDESGTIDEENSYRVIRYSYVFNAAQVEGWESPELKYPNLAERIQAAEDFVTACGADIQTGHDGAYYMPLHDRIVMPPWEAFRDTETSTATENAYSTLLHELTHWTSHKRRCDRDQAVARRFKEGRYAVEELVAELGSAFLCAELGIEKEPRVDHAQYIAHWLEALKKDKRAIFWAAARASEAVDFLEELQNHNAPTQQSVPATAGRMVA